MLVILMMSINIDTKRNWIFTPTYLNVYSKRQITIQYSLFLEITELDLKVDTVVVVLRK